MIKQFFNVLRRNHALEHATISILLSRLGHHTRVIGRAVPDGFYIYGNFLQEEVLESSRLALARLRRGESELAVSPFCGTNLALAGILAGLGSSLAIGNGDRRGRLPSAVLAATLAVLAAQPLGRLVQKHVTTTSDLSNLEILSVEPAVRGYPRLHKVRTGPVSS